MQLKKKHLCIAALLLLGILSACGGGLPSMEPTTEVAPTNTATSLTPATSTQLPTVTNTQQPTANPAQSLDERTRQVAETGVTVNDEWDPVIATIHEVEMALVPAGCFEMGSTEEQVDYAMEIYGSGAQRSWFENEQPAHEVCFEEPFWIDVYEVTNAQYGSSGSRAGDNLPRETINWFDAVAHCEARGARLPTEAEWEYVARGPDGLIFPWGDIWVGTNAIWATSSPAIVGSKPEGVSWVGAYDLSGNVWEWVNDWFNEEYYATLVEGEVNPQGPINGSFRVFRGGALNIRTSHHLRAAYRPRDTPYSEMNSLGFRCALPYEP
jgi:formylglycine-generating enzyme required for sulfatase activity